MLIRMGIFDFITFERFCFRAVLLLRLWAQLPPDEPEIYQPDI